MVAKDKEILSSIPFYFDVPQMMEILKSKKAEDFSDTDVYITQLNPKYDENDPDSKPLMEEKFPCKRVKVEHDGKLYSLSLSKEIGITKLLKVEVAGEFSFTLSKTAWDLKEVK